MARRRNPQYMSPQELHLWKRQINQQDRYRDKIDRDAERAETTLEDAESNAEKRLRKARADADAASAKRSAEWAAEEKKILSQPRTVYRGGTVGQPTMWVTHTKAEMPSPLATMLEIGGAEAHRLVRLRAGGGLGPGDAAPEVVGAARPDITGTEYFEAWWEAVRPLIAEVRTRYQILARLRDDNWLAGLLGAAGVLPAATSQTHTRAGTYGTYPYALNVVDVPRLVDARIGRTGLSLTFGHQPGMSAKAWNAKLDRLQAGFAAAGMPSGGLVITDGDGGSIRLHFNDRDAFADMPAGTVVSMDVERGRSYIGQVADGSDAWMTWKNNALGLIAGMQGGGKTASMLPVLAGLAAHAELHLLDGNSSGEWAALAPMCATYDESGEIHKLADLIESLFPVARGRLRKITQSTGDINFWDVPAAKREAMGLYPIVIAVEEAPQFLSKNQVDKEGKEAAARNMTFVGKAVKLFRKAGITVLLIVQKPVESEIPTIIRDMAGSRLCFRLDSDTAAATVLGDAAYVEPKPSSIPPGKPGRFVARVDARGSVLGQAPYVPIADIRAALADVAPVPDQRAGYAGEAEADAVIRPPDAEPISDQGRGTPEMAQPTVGSPVLSDADLLTELRRRGLATEAVPADEPPETQTTSTPDTGGFDL